MKHLSSSLLLLTLFFSFSCKSMDISSFISIGGSTPFPDFSRVKLAWTTNGALLAFLYPPKKPDRIPTALVEYSLENSEDPKATLSPSIRTIVKERKNSSTSELSIYQDDSTSAAVFTIRSVEKSGRRKQKSICSASKKYLAHFSRRELGVCVRTGEDEYMISDQKERYMWSSKAAALVLMPLRWGQLRIYDALANKLHTNKIIRDYEAFDFDATGQFLATLSKKKVRKKLMKRIYIWNIDSLKKPVASSTVSSKTQSIAWHPTQLILAYGGTRQEKKAVYPAVSRWNLTDILTRLRKKR